MSDDFALDSNGFFKGCVGAIDGLTVPIRRSVGVADAGNYFCRKIFYAINVQAICNKQKRFTWLSFHQGSSHDSFAWSQTRLQELLEATKEKMKEHGFFWWVTLPIHYLRIYWFHTTKCNQVRWKTISIFGFLTRGFELNARLVSL